MAYTPPVGNAIELNFQDVYTPPAGDDVILDFQDFPEPSKTTICIVTGTIIS